MDSSERALSFPISTYMPYPASALLRLCQLLVLFCLFARACPAAEIDHLLPALPAFLENDDELEKFRRLQKAFQLSKIDDDVRLIEIISLETDLKTDISMLSLVASGFGRVPTKEIHFYLEVKRLPRDTVMQSVRIPIEADAAWRLYELWKKLVSSVRYPQVDKFWVGDQFHSCFINGKGRRGGWVPFGFKTMGNLSVLQQAVLEATIWVGSKGSNTEAKKSFWLRVGELEAVYTKAKTGKTITREKRQPKG